MPFARFTDACWLYAAVITGAMVMIWPSIRGIFVRTKTAALYVDFDNIYSGLAKLDVDAAEVFANDPGRLLRMLESGRDETGAFKRRFLVRDCYLNPHSFAKYRAQFVAAGFRVVDCPSLTKQGKSAADIAIVIDAVDALSHATRYDEFVICSADADFSPLMTKIRRHDRRTLMVAASNAATAYEAVCDEALGAMDLLGAFMAEVVAQVEEIEPLSVARSDLEPQAALAAEAVRVRVASSENPVPGSAAAAAAGRASPGIAGTRWANTGGFAAFVRAYVPELTYVTTSSGGLVLDPTRHKNGALAPNLGERNDVISRVARVTRVPLLSSEQYAVLFSELSVVAKEQTRLTRIGFDVRERAADSSAPVPRKSVDFVVSGLVYAGCDLRDPSLGPLDLGERWLANVYYLCDQSGLELDTKARSVVESWILGALRKLATT